MSDTTGNWKPALSLARRCSAVVMLAVILGAIGWASVVFDQHVDFSHGARGTLTEPSRNLLAAMTQPLTVRVYAAPNSLARARASSLLDKYQRFKPAMVVQYVDPAEVPAELRQQGLDAEGELVVSYQGRTQTVREHSERALSSALARLIRDEERWLVWMTGHGERSFSGHANHDLGLLGEHLQQTGVRPQPLNLTAVDNVPDNTSTLVVSAPQTPLLDAETKRLQRYVRSGGNLLWMMEPGDGEALDWLAAELGVHRVAGTVVDPGTPLMGIEQPTIVVITEYTDHPAVDDFELVTLMPEVAAIETTAASNWKASVLARSRREAWSDTDLDSGVASFDASADQAGPLTLAMALEREHPDPTRAGTQRVVVVGDGDFLSNAYVGNGGNLALGTTLVNWLMTDEDVFQVPVREAPDRFLTLTKTHALVIGFSSLFGIPGAFLITGLGVWWKRRRD